VRLLPLRSLGGKGKDALSAEENFSPSEEREERKEEKEEVVSDDLAI